MADNYLENRMADLRAGKLKPQAVRRKKKGALADLRALVIGNNAEAVEAKVTELRREDCRVAFAYIETKPDSSGIPLNARGSDFARKSGARFYPNGELTASFIADTLAHLLHDWKGLELLYSAGIDSPMLREEFDKAIAGLPYQSAHGSRLVQC